MKAAFRGYYRPTKEEFSELWSKATFVFDANVLLGVYRYSASTTSNLLAILDSLKDRVWLPHQAGLEFHKNRLKVISAQVKEYEAIAKALIENSDRMMRHPFVQPQRLAVFRDLAGKVSAWLDDVRKEQLDLLGHDPLRDRLTELFSGKVGPRYTSEELSKKQKEADERLARQVPPGYKDAGKAEGRQYGDVLLWFQVKDYARETKQPVILVTDERKEDWWLEHEGKIVGPRPELIEEFTQDTKAAFYLYRSDQFLERAQEAAGKKDQSAVDEVRAVADRPRDRRAVATTMEEFFERRARRRIRGALDAIIRRQAPNPGGSIPLLETVCDGLGVSAGDAKQLLEIFYKLGWITDLTSGYESGRLTESGFSAVIEARLDELDDD